jgi:hypothetical protein
MGRQHSQLQSRQLISSSSLCVSGPRLLLEEIDTPVRYEITPVGLRNSERKQRDRKVFAGSLHKDRAGKVVNDIVMENDE